MYFPYFTLNTDQIYQSFTKTLLHYSFTKHRHFWALLQRHKCLKLSVNAIWARCPVSGIYPTITGQPKQKIWQRQGPTTPPSRRRDTAGMTVPGPGLLPPQYPKLQGAVQSCSSCSPALLLLLESWRTQQRKLWRHNPATEAVGAGSTRPLPTASSMAQPSPPLTKTGRPPRVGKWHLRQRMEKREAETLGLGLAGSTGTYDIGQSLADCWQSIGLVLALCSPPPKSHAKGCQQQRCSSARGRELYVTHYEREPLLTRFVMSSFRF